MTKLVVQHYHELSNHSAGTKFLVSQISRRFWIVAACEEISARENECSEFKRCRNKPVTQIMGPLSQVRRRFTFGAFDQTAVDLASTAKEVVVCFYTLIDSSTSSRNGVGS